MNSKSCCCCSDNTSQRKQIQVLDENSSQKSSGPECMDKETQKTPELMSEIVTVQSAATSETHFNRNNENLSTPQKPYCPIQVDQATTYAPHLSAMMGHQASFNVTCQCEQLTSLPNPNDYLWLYQNTQANEDNNPPLHSNSAGSQSNGEPSTISSSNTTSEHFSLRLILSCKNNANITSAAYPNYSNQFNMPYMVPKPMRLEPQCINKPQCLATTAMEDLQYQSCCSASSEDDYTPATLNQERYQSILKLMHQMMHLLTESRKTKDMAQPGAGDKKSGMSPKLDNKEIMKSHRNKRNICGITNDESNDDIKTEGPCSKSPQYLHRLKCQPSQTTKCRCDNTKLRNAPIIESHSINACGCSKTTATIANSKKEENSSRNNISFTWPPCFCHYMAILASTLGELMPSPEQFSTIPHNSEATAQSVVKSEESKKEPSKSESLAYQNPTDYEEILSEDPLLDNDEELAYAEKEENESKADLQVMYIDESMGHDIDQDSSYVYEERAPMNSIEELPVESLSPLLSKMQEIEGELHSLNRDIEQLKSMESCTQRMLAHLKEQPFENVSNQQQFPGNCYGRADGLENEGDSIDHQQSDEECELEKEELAERYKNRSHKDPCDCCHCREKRLHGHTNCTMLAAGQASPPAQAEDFKYFIKSLEMDLEAMEHTRRKNDVMQNICRPKTEVCCRKSFPVTILDVENLGATSLYVKWTIHDCYGIAGYEIFVDGHLTNRYYHSRHEAAVVCNVDITRPHKIALAAQPLDMNDDSLAMLCKSNKSKNRCKPLAWNTPISSADTNRYSLWTPSIYLYHPAEYQTL